MTRTFVTAIHSIAIVATYVFGVAALISVFVGLGFALLLFGISIGCHFLDIFIEQKLSSNSHH